MQLLWSRDFTSVHLALNQEWPQDICKYMTTLKGKQGSLLSVGKFFLVNKSPFFFFFNGLC